MNQPLTLILSYLAVFGFGPIALFVLIRLFLNAADDSTKPFVHWTVVGLVCWWIVATIFTLTIGLSQNSFFIALFIPLAFISWLILTPQISAILAKVRLEHLVLIGVYRVAGAIFLYVYFVENTLSAGFALNAGWGDILTGVLALPVSYLVWKSSPFSSIAVVVWSLIGIGDLILAPASAIIFGAQDLTLFPLSLIPLLVGPPFGIVLHLITLRALWLQR